MEPRMRPCCRIRAEGRRIKIGLTSDWCFVFGDSEICSSGLSEWDLLLIICCCYRSGEDLTRGCIWRFVLSCSQPASSEDLGEASGWVVQSGLRLRDVNLDLTIKWASHMLLNRTEGRSSCIFELVPIPGSYHLWQTVTRFYPSCSYLLNSTIRKSWIW